ncbi:MAG: hypothetical protein AAF089_15340 [Bacteroidota bacterium]
MSDARSDYAGFSHSYAGKDLLPLRATPTVSRSQWTNVLLRKLGDGFALVQDPTGRRFAFYQPGHPTQACPLHAAKHLLASGMPVAARTSARGLHYALSDGSAVPALVPRHELDNDTSTDTDHALNAELVAMANDAGGKDLD